MKQCFAGLLSQRQGFSTFGAASAGGLSSLNIMLFSVSLLQYSQAHPEKGPNRPYPDTG